MEQFKKKSDEVLDYDLILKDWLDGDLISGCSVAIDGSDLQLQSQNVLDDRVKLWLENGKKDADYIVTASITTQMGRTKIINFKMRVRD